MRIIALLCLLLLSLPCIGKPKPGPIAGQIGYWGTKAICWGTISAASNWAIKKAFRRNHCRHCPQYRRNTYIANVSHRAITSLDGIPTGLGSGVVEATINHHHLQPQAAEACGAVITSAGGAAATHGIIESAALSVGAFLTAIPWLP